MSTRIATIETDRGPVYVTAYVDRGEGGSDRNRRRVELVHAESSAAEESCISLTDEDAAQLLYQLGSWEPCRQALLKWLEEPGENVLRELLKTLWAPMRERAPEIRECLEVVPVVESEAMLHIDTGREVNGSPVVDFKWGPVCMTLFPLAAADLSYALEQWRPCYEALVRTGRVTDEEDEPRHLPLHPSLEATLGGILKQLESLRVCQLLTALPYYLDMDRPGDRAVRMRLRAYALECIATWEGGGEHVHGDPKDRASSEQWERCDPHTFPVGRPQHVESGDMDPEPQTFPVKLPEDQPPTEAKGNVYLYTLTRDKKLECTGELSADSRQAAARAAAAKACKGPRMVVREADRCTRAMDAYLLPDEKGEVRILVWEKEQPDRLYGFTIHRSPPHGREHEPGEVAFAGVVRAGSRENAAAKATEAKVGASHGNVSEVESKDPAFGLFRVTDTSYTIRTWEAVARDEEGGKGDA